MLILRRYLRPAGFFLIFAVIGVLTTRIYVGKDIVHWRNAFEETKQPQSEEKDYNFPEILADVDDDIIEPQPTTKAKILKLKPHRKTQRKETYSSTAAVTSTTVPAALQVSTISPKVESKFAHERRNNKIQKEMDALPKGWAYKGPDNMRCQVHTMGCFLPTPKDEEKAHSVLVDSSPEMTDWYCITLCSKSFRKKYMFAGLRNGNECHCSSYVQDIVQMEESSKCNVTCPGDLTLNCGGRKGITMLYQLLSPCRLAQVLPGAVSEESIIGCFPKPNDIATIMKENLVDKEWSATKCLLLCERSGLILAVPMYPNQCYCGFNSHTFEMTNPVDMMYCTENSEDYVTVLRTLSEDRRCDKKRFLKEGELQRKIGLVTFPGSGNTWLRYLIESVTGIYTGSVYMDVGLLNGGYMGENVPPQSSKIAVVKSHHQWDIKNSKYLEAVINVYRNPYNALLSEFNRRGKGHTGSIDPASFNKEKFEGISTGDYVRKWRLTTSLAIDTPLPKLIFSYEDLVNDTLLYAEKLARFILGNGVNEKDLKDRLLCLRLASRGQFKRKKKPLDFDPYTELSKIEINDHVKNLAKQLAAAGFDPEPENYIRPLPSR